MMRKEGRRPNSPASFYKIILPSTIADKKLRIPEKFVAAHGDELSTVTTLIIPDGCSWKVGIEKAEQMVWFCDGWQNLVDHYSITAGDFLIFKYEGRSTFNVFIYDITSTQIHYPSRTLTSPEGSKRCLQSDEEDMEGHDSLEDLRSQKSRSYMSSKRYRNEDERVTSILEKECIAGESNLNNNGLQSNSCEFVNLENNVGEMKFRQMKGADPEKGSSRRRHKVQYGGTRHSLTTDGVNLISPSFANGLEWSVVKSEEEEVSEFGIRSCCTNIFMATKLTNQERERANHAARMFTSKNPSFVVIIRRMSLRPTNLLDVPSEFCESYMRDPGTKVELEFLDERWPVFTVRRTARSLSLSKGWSAFANKHCLSVGDICVFELIQYKDIVLRVSILRAVEVCEETCS